MVPDLLLLPAAGRALAPAGRAFEVRRASSRGDRDGNRDGSRDSGASYGNRRSRDTYADEGEAGDWNEQASAHAYSDDGSSLDASAADGGYATSVSSFNDSLLH